MTRTAPFFLILISITVFALVSLKLNSTEKSTKHASNLISPTNRNKTSDVKRNALRSTANAAKQFLKNKSYNEEFCFLIDMTIRSGSNRFFVYDLKHDSILTAGTVTHGRCNERWLSGRKYGNEPGCGCTSLGKYKIGKPYMGRFGLAYKLHGLDSTNSNAFKRYVVLHAHDCVPANEVFTEICQSDGCPTVSPNYLKKLQRLIDDSPKPVLLLIYE